MRFFNFYVAYMVQKYQNESAPIFYYGKSPKTNRKHLKIPYLQALTLGRVIKMTLYKVINAVAVETKAANHRHIIVAITSYNGP